jgi:hypothetical protein
MCCHETTSPFFRTVYLESFTLQYSCKLYRRIVFVDFILIELEDRQVQPPHASQHGQVRLSYDLPSPETRTFGLVFRVNLRQIVGKCLSYRFFYWHAPDFHVHVLLYAF